MAYETLVAVYDTPPHAEAAVKALKAAGFDEFDISMFEGGCLKAGRTSLSPGVKEAGLWHRLFGTDVHEHEANIYGQTVEDGGVVISVRVPESEVAHASAVLNIHRPVDGGHDRAVTSGVAPAAHVEAVEKRLAAVPLAAEQQVAVSPKLAAAHPRGAAPRRGAFGSRQRNGRNGPNTRSAVRNRARSRPGCNPPRRACGSAAQSSLRSDLRGRNRLGGRHDRDHRDCRARAGQQDREESSKKSGLRRSAPTTSRRSRTSSAANRSKSSASEQTARSFETPGRPSRSRAKSPQPIWPWDSAIWRGPPALSRFHDCDASRLAFVSRGRKPIPCSQRGGLPNALQLAERQPIAGNQNFE